jgi:HlyD family secretion protein
MASNGRNGRRRRRIIFGLIGLVLLVGIVGAMAMFRSKPTIDPSKLVAVERGSIARSVVATGKIEPLAKVEIKSKASGIVKQIYADYGDRVRQGQVLVELDREELAARVREARATLQAAEAGLAAAQAALERNTVEAEGPDVPFLKSAVERAQQLYSDGLIAKSALEEAEKNYQLALNRQTAALRNLGVSRADVARSRAQVAQTQAALERAEEDLRNATITSPIDGIVLSRDVEIGDAVSSILVLGANATRVMTLGDTSDVYVLGRVDEADIARVYIGQPARIRVESFKDKTFEGQVTKISPLGVERDNVTTFEVRVSISNPGGELKANMTANAEIILEEKHDVLLVPESAVVYDRERNTFLELPDPAADTGRKRVAVKLGISSGIKTEVAEGVSEGQQVILQ